MSYNDIPEPSLVPPEPDGDINDCGHSQFRNEWVIDFNGKWLCEECFLEEIQNLIDERAIDTLADLVMSDHWRVE